MKTQSQIGSTAAPKGEDSVTSHNFSGIFVIRRRRSSTTIFNSLPERFKAKVSRKANGCWVWTAGTRYHSKHKQYRYGIYAVDGRDSRSVIYAHRFAYEFVYGPLLLDQLDIDHACQNKLCVNPKHLRPLTHQDNCRLRRKRQRVPGSKRWLKEQVAK